MHIFIHIPDSKTEDLAIDIVENDRSQESLLIQVNGLLLHIQKLKQKNGLPDAKLLYSVRELKQVEQAIKELKKDSQAVYSKKKMGPATALRSLFQKVTSKVWDQEPLHNSQCNYLQLSDTNTELLTQPHVLAEVTERQFEHPHQTQILLSLLPSEKEWLYGIRCATFIDAPFLSKVEVISSSEGINELSEDLISKKIEYDPNSRITPRDYQTILRDADQFIPTGMPKYQGRTIYREKKTGRLFYVDNFHDTAPHLEVFDSRGKEYIGKANITTGEITEATKEEKNKKKPIVRS